MAKLRKEILHILSSFIIIIWVVMIGIFAMYSIITTALDNTNNNTLFSVVRNSWCNDVIEEPVLKRTDKIVILRLDDVQAFAWTDISIRIIKDSYKYNAPVVAWVIPKTIHEDLRLENFLKRENCNIEIAMHGWDHYGKPSEILWQKYVTEFWEISREEAKERFLSGITVLKKYNNNNKAPITFIPPFNLISNEARGASLESWIKVISSIWAWFYDYHASTYNFDNKRLIRVENIVSDCEKSFETSPVCVIMVHPQDYSNSKKELDEELYHDYYVRLLDELKKRNVKFATFEQIYWADF
jgi:predicted deacetylase